MSMVDKIRAALASDVHPSAVGDYHLMPPAQPAGPLTKDYRLVVANAISGRAGEAIRLAARRNPLPKIKEQQQ